ncbi:MAG: cyclin domain-containing protein, partial [Benjaminiella poitrasii]
IVALIYLGRLKSNLPSKSRGEFDTPYKMFIAAVILASKFVEDSNKIAQSIYRFVAPLYNHKEINEMERSFLGVVKYDLFVNLVEVCQFVKEHKDTLELEF